MGYDIINDMRKMAIFDVDGTIFRSSLLIELTEMMIEEGIWEPEVKLGYKKEADAWIDRKGSYEDYIKQLIDVFMVNIKGVRYVDFDKVVNKVIKKCESRVYVYTRELVKELKKKKYFLLAISQSPKAILDPFCGKLGFDKIYGRFYELGPGDRFTGAVTDEHLISNKANIVRRVLEKEKLTLKGSIGVGDTEGDFSFLELVEHPICFNPNAKLFRHAKRNKWQVVVERKDVIYEI
ncbi:MAG: HAD-IB family hydrolase [Candidatus Taylorbacteria bacterium]|nr:HAD-IB family hydrolase [Candidatus Taylorbacteria bacterium]